MIHLCAAFRLPRVFRTPSWLLMILLLGAATAPAKESAMRTFDLPAGPAVESVKRFARQADREIIFAVEPLANIRTSAVHGQYVPGEALKRLLAATPLTAVEDPKTGAFVVFRPSHPPPPAAPPPSTIAKEKTSMKPKKQLAAVAAWLLAALAPASLHAAPPRSTTAITGTISGTVTNQNTGNGLEGAVVSIPQLGMSALVDKTGRYLLSDVPAGPHELTATYTGLDTARATVSVPANRLVTRDFILTNDIYRMEAFTVSGEREGNAAAIMAQRNADNAKEVVSMDAYGNLPNLNATELAIRMPGVTFATPGDEVVETISIRGMGAGSNTITIDGGLMSSFGAESRATRMTAFTGAMFESFEIIKGHTPDSGADSLGGTMNFRTRSPLSMREKRRFAYTVSATIAPSFTEQVPMRQQHRSHPLINASYQEKFAAFGSQEDNLAVSVNVFYSENVFGFFNTTYDYQQTNNYPGYVWDYRTMDNYNNRKQMSYTTKFDYRISPRSRLSLNLIYNDAPEPGRHQYQTRAFAGSATTVPNNTTSGVVPGWTDRVTVVRAVPTPANATPSSTPAAAIDQTSYFVGRNQRLRHVDLSGEHNLEPFGFDWAALCSRTRYAVTGNEGTLNMRIGGVPFIGPNGSTGSASNNIVGPHGESGVGWILDRTGSMLYPKFIQNGGLDFTDPANYRPTVNGLTSGSGEYRTHSVYDLRGNAKYLLPLDFMQAYLKTGGDFRQQIVQSEQNSRRWSYIGRDPLPTAGYVLWDDVKNQRHIPVWEVTNFMNDGRPLNPALWQEDRYYHEQIRYTGNYDIREKVYAAYLMTQGKIGRYGFITGLRGERTDTDASSYVRSRVPSTTAQQQADPVGAATADYAGNRRDVSGSYTKYFPSVHLSRDFTRNLKGRASWSTSFGRPSLLESRATETVNESAQTLTVGNPALLPQTAKNWDLSLDYYFEPAGSVNVAWFHKTINDYIIRGQNAGVIADGPDNGYGGQYAGFTKLTSGNAGTAISEGWEFSYLQQFRFLPGLLKGLSFNANMTLINTHGDFGGTDYRKNKEVPGFIPRTSNVSLSWNYKKFGTRILYNYTAENIRSYTAGQPSRNQYMLSRELVNLGLTYRLNPRMTLQMDIANLFNEPQRYYRGIPDQLQQFLIQGTRITIGIQGQL